MRLGCAVPRSERPGFDISTGQLFEKLPAIDSLATVGLSDGLIKFTSLRFREHRFTWILRKAPRLESVQAPGPRLSRDGTFARDTGE